MTSLFPLGTGTGVAVAVDHAMLECRFNWVLVQVVVSVIDPPTLSRESILMASFPACKVTDSECAVEVVRRFQLQLATATAEECAQARA